MLILGFLVADFSGMFSDEHDFRGKRGGQPALKNETNSLSTEVFDVFTRRLMIKEVNNLASAEIQDQLWPRTEKKSAQLALPPTNKIKVADATNL
ncbi:hypothetical protein J6590_016634 [Homalodisca vitripennis]|nr:hypothetical protein J6590_016634 [Homalodisca vitripennis]